MDLKKTKNNNNNKKTHTHTWLPSEHFSKYSLFCIQQKKKKLTTGLERHEGE